MPNDQTEAWILAFTLILARVAALVATLPLFGGRNLPNIVKVGFSVSLAAMWFGTFGVEPSDDVLRLVEQSHWLGMGLAAAREAIFGAVLGMAFGLLLLPVRIAGAYIGQEMGLNMATLTDPNQDGSSSVVAQFYDVLSVLLFFVLDIHHVLLLSVHGAFERWPCGSPLALAPAGRVAMGMADAQQWGLLISAPVGVCLFVTVIVLLLMAKASPQLNLFTFGMPVRLGVGLAGMFLFLPDTCLLIQRLFLRVGGLMDGVLRH